MTLTPRRVDEGVQVRALARTYLARFFDNELTGGSTDLTHSFLWLIAALAMPGVALPNNAFERWGRIAMVRAPEGGPDYLRMVAGVDIVFALGVTMVAVGLLAAIVWQALLIDRRDVQVVGSFPVRHRTILTGKFLAVGAFFGIVSAGMHTLGAFFYGVHLGIPIGGAHAGRLVVVHLVVSSAAGLFAFTSVIAAQGLLLAVVGPRRFSRLAPTLQLIVIALVVLLLVVLPFAAAGVLGPVYALDPAPQPWVLLVPPVWFLGLYETLLGTPLPVLHGLAGRALLALGVVLAVALTTYPLAFRRVALSAMTSTSSPARRSWPHRAAARLPALLCRHGVGQATVQFMLATLGRVGLHRMVIAIMVGVALAIAIPIVGGHLASWPAEPTPGLLAITTVFMLLTLTGLRITLSLPAEAPAAWLFAVTAGHGWVQHRRAARRLLLLLGVALPIAGTLPISLVSWGAGAAVTHAAFSWVAGWLVTEILIAGLDHVPFTAPYEPGRAKLHARWPWMLILALFLTTALPEGEAEFIRLRMATPLVVVAALMAAGALVARAVAQRRLPPPGALDLREETVGVVLH